MKTVLIVILALLASATSIAQPYLGLTVTNKGAGMQTGVLVAQMVDLNINYNTRVVSNGSVPSCFSANAGLRLIMSGFESNRQFLATPMIGYAITKWDDHSGAHVEPDGKVVPMISKNINYGLELAYQVTNSSMSRSGEEKRKIVRMFLSGSYGHTFYASFGAKVFLVK